MKSRSSTVASEVVGTWLPLLPLSPLVHLAASTPHFFLLLEHAKHVCALRYLHCLFLLVESSEVRFPQVCLLLILWVSAHMLPPSRRLYRSLYLNCPVVHLSPLSITVLCFVDYQVLPL